MSVNKATAVLTVEAIEPVLPFWVDRLGFEKVTEVPEGDRIGFVILQQGGAEIMYQTLESLKHDAPHLVPDPWIPNTMLFLEVDDIDAIEGALQGIEPVVPRRKTFYGSTEIFVREPGGHIVGFAQFGTEA